METKYTHRFVLILQGPSRGISHGGKLFWNKLFNDSKTSLLSTDFDDANVTMLS